MMCNTTLGPESEHSPHNTLGSESELVGEFEDNSSSAQKGNHSPHNSEVPDTRAESEQPGVLKKGYAMMCDFCGVENCRSGYNKPVLMMCYLCRSSGKHWPKNCPSGLYRGAPMPEQYGCFNKLRRVNKIKHKKGINLITTITYGTRDVQECLVMCSLLEILFAPAEEALGLSSYP